MSGDSFGSPRRDDRPSFDPQGPWEIASSHDEDVKVAGASFDQSAPAPSGRGGDTAGLPAVPPDGFAPAPARAGMSVGVKIAAVVAGAAVVVGGGAVAAFALTGDSGAKPSTLKPGAAAPLADAAVPQVDPQALEAQRRKQAVDRASRAVRTAGKAPAVLPKGKPIPKKTEAKKKTGGDDGGAGSDPVPAGEAQQIAKGMLGSFGFSGSGQFACLVKLWNRESGWRTNAANPSGAYGIPQALPGSKMASAGSDWRTSARTQIKWGLGYIKGRYSSPCGAWAHSQSTGWY
ncbi:aggregation-promoting factor C-terminal-like domain-containing protein [Actinomadura macrotermitis]|uniref:Lytic transglycosylase domain-containing protein n=1 Tax=Actinomadura macrotermitis TaxID=2585200 RepID=A0A7K0BRV0_9ACTN|nr:lytic transglycosylase domain-containing protein [Actinomadura macrotermitis]MQY03918.1 hypothetical protein [Actinomadura macrotermitis]